MQNQADSTGKLIIVSVFVGILLLIGAAFFFNKPETITLPLKFEEFTDFQCPACGLYHPVVKQILSEFATDNNIDFKFKNFPLTTIHENAYQAALAGQAARLQGKFSEYSDVLFENQEKLTREDLISYATKLNLDVAKFTTDMDSTDVKAYIDSDIAEATARGVNATPTFYINGRKVVFKETDNPEDVLRKLLKEKIELGLKQKSEVK